MKKSLFSIFLFLSCLFSTYAENLGFVAEYGRLKLVGNQLSSEKGDAIQLRGINTGVIGEDACLYRNTFKTIKEWGLSSVRLNYSPYTHSEENVARLKSYIDICAELGLYAIVDWHIFESDNHTNTGNPSDYADEAKAFFKTISAYVKEKGYIHVIYDICNEPSGVNWKGIKEYAEEILPIIETNDPGAIVIIGTPDWCQKIIEPVADPINAKDYSLGIMYSFHYYACSHYSFLGDLRVSMKSIPVYVSEWTSGKFDYSNETVCEMESDILLSTLDSNIANSQIVSWNYWSWGDTGIWKNCEDGVYKENLTETGKYLVNLLNVTLDSKPAELEYVANFKEYGRLKLVGNQLSSEKGDAIQLRGINTGVIGEDACLYRNTFKTIKEWGLSSVRLNYSPYTHSAENVARLKSYIDICAEQGLYAIVDWHIEVHDNNSGVPMKYINEATEFFEEISTYAKEKGYMHVIYDICNEPSGVNWKGIKEYAEEILPIIETNDPGAIVIIGTPNWCQKITDPITNPINAYDYNLGIMYSFHYYACSHYHLLGDLRESMKSIPVYVSEWTSGKFDLDNDNACDANSDYLLSTLDSNTANSQIVSWNYWSWGNTGIWKNCEDGVYQENLTGTGKYLVNLLNVTLDSKPAESEYVVNFKKYGRLKLVGNQLSSEKGDAIQLKGISTGVIGEDACLDKNTFNTIRKWGLSSVRLNYSPYTHSAENVARLKSYIDICAEQGLYAIVDWHIEVHDNNSGVPMKYINEATEFFEEISTYAKEKGYMHVIYDICNEPSGVNWKGIKEYAEEILPIIETNDPGAIVIIGTPNWCQKITDPITNPINAYDYNLGIMYSFHYYACSHYHLLGDLKASVKSIPVYVSEWTSGEYDYSNETACESESDYMLSILDPETAGVQLVSWNYWSWGNTGIWKNCEDGVYKENLTGTGKYLVDLLNVTLDSKSEYVVNFKEYGRLKLVGRQLCSENGDTVQLKGFNTGVIGKDIYECLDKSAFQTMKEWGCKSVRLNYSPYTNSSENLKIIKSYIDICAELGLYAIVDWHIFEEGETRSGNPMDYISEATDFFDNISTYVKKEGYMHVLYDICNEPSGTDWKSIKNYAAEILPIIESNDPGAIVIIGTADWCQQIYEASLSPIRAKDYDLGIMYSFHYSACSHADLLANLKNALVSVPVFISEWSGSDYTYQPDKVCETESNLLLNIISKYGNVAVSWNYWAWAGETGIWKKCENRKYKEDLTKTGEFITNLLNVNLKSKPIVYKWEENFAEFGRLNTQSGHDFALYSESGKVVQLKGFNTGIIDEDVSACLSKEAFQAMKDWGCSSVRLNYSPYTHSDEKMELIKSYIDICGEVGLYAIVDWHILGDNETRSGNPNDYIDDAKSFFSTISSYVKEERYMHVLYDICNEPSGIDWKSIKDYATEILPIIESNDPGAIVIVGTPNWCQKILDPVKNEIDTKNLGIVYSFHYSACDHVDLVGDLRQAMKYYPVFISELTSSNSKYDIDEVCSENASKLLENLDNNHQIVSWNYWAWAGETGIWKKCGANYQKDNLNKVGSYILVDTDEFNYPYKSESLVDDFDNDRFVEVVPNPAGESFSVRFKGNANVCIYNTTGQKVLEKEASNVLNVNENLTSGIYNIVVRCEDYVENIKLIVK